LTDAPTRSTDRRSMNRWLAIADLEAAINRARHVQPASGPESSLTLEVATLGALYGRLIWEHRDGIELDALTDAERVAVRLWLPRTPAGGTPSGIATPGERAG
jgi:hypothetical protein